MTILLNGWIFPIGQIGEASWWKVCYQRGLPRLDFIAPEIHYMFCGTSSMWTKYDM